MTRPQSGRRPIEEVIPEITEFLGPNRTWLEVSIPARAGLLARLMHSRLGVKVRDGGIEHRLTSEREIELMEESLRTGMVHPDLPTIPADELPRPERAG